MKFSPVCSVVISGAFASVSNIVQLSNGLSLINANPNDVEKFESAISLVSSENEIETLSHYVSVYNRKLLAFKTSAIAGLEASIITPITKRVEISQYAPNLAKTCPVYQLANRERKVIDFAETIVGFGKLESHESEYLCRILEGSLRSPDQAMVKLDDLKTKIVFRLSSTSEGCSSANLFGATQEDIALFEEVVSGLGNSFEGKRRLSSIVRTYSVDKISAQQTLVRLAQSVRGRIQTSSIAPRVADECFLSVNLLEIPAQVLLKAEDAFANGSGDETIQICQVLSSYRDGEIKFTLESLGYLKRSLEDYALARASF